MALSLLVIFEANAVDVTRLINNKETRSRELSSREIEASKQWAGAHVLGAALKKLSEEVLSKGLQVSNACEIGLIREVKSSAVQKTILTSEDEMPLFLSYLRTENIVDDILYRILSDSFDILEEFQHVTEETLPRRIFKRGTTAEEGLDLSMFFSDVRSWDRSIEDCSLDR